MKTNPRIAVSGLNRGDNPQPGSGIIRSIRRAFPDATIIGLAYDAMESGIYVEGGPDENPPHAVSRGGHRDAFFRKAGLDDSPARPWIFTSPRSTPKTKCSPTPGAVTSSAATAAACPDPPRSGVVQNSLCPRWLPNASVQVPGTKIAHDTRAGHARRRGTRLPAHRERPLLRRKARKLPGGTFSHRHAPAFGMGRPGHPATLRPGPRVQARSASATDGAVCSASAASAKRPCSRKKARAREASPSGNHASPRFARASSNP